jgi:hypothetical protein
MTLLDVIGEVTALSQLSGKAALWRSPSASGFVEQRQPRGDTP